MMHRLCLLIVLCISLVYGQGTLQKLTPRYHLKQGDNVTLDCYVQNYQATTAFTVSWSKDGNPITFGEMPNFANNRWTLDTSVIGHYKIIIKDVMVADNGTWRCTYGPTGHVNFQETFTLLRIIAPVQLIDWSRPVEREPGLRQSFSLYCNATGSPAATIIWRRTYPDNFLYDNLNKKQEFVTEPVLRFSNVTEGHRGIYECSASNGVGTTARREFAIRLPYEPQVKSVVSTFTLTQGMEGKLSCMSMAFPAVTSSSDVTWRRNGQIINEDSEIRTGEDREMTTSILTIQNVTYALGKASYTCSFRNNRGEGVATFDVETRQKIIPDAGAVRSAATSPSLHSVICVLLASVFLFLL